MTLTHAQTQVARLFLEGKRHTEIAEELGISKFTVGVHVHNIRNRLKIKGGTVNLFLTLRKVLKQSQP